MLPTDTITAGSALKSVSESVKAARLTKNHSQREKTCHWWSVTQQITLIRTFPGSVGKLVGVFGSWSLRKPRKTACAVICPICLSGAGFRKRIKDVKGWWSDFCKGTTWSEPSGWNSAQDELESLNFTYKNNRGERDLSSWVTMVLV